MNEDVCCSTHREYKPKVGLDVVIFDTLGQKMLLPVAQFDTTLNYSG